MLHEFTTPGLHFITTPATDMGGGIVFPDFPDQVTAMQISGRFPCNDVILHEPFN